MVVHIQTNGTLRIYHGYPQGHADECCHLASREDEKAQGAFDAGKRSEEKHKLLAFLEYEYPDMTSEEQRDLLNQILDTMYSYDPGIGVNRPGSKS
jgi:hypothetical protein